jgi:hypothetical protein
MFKMSIRGG